MATSLAMLDSPLAACAACSAPSDLAFEWVDLQETQVAVVLEFCFITKEMIFQMKGEERMTI